MIILYLLILFAATAVGGSEDEIVLSEMIEFAKNVSDTNSRMFPPCKFSANCFDMLEGLIFSQQNFVNLTREIKRVETEIEILNHGSSELISRSETLVGRAESLVAGRRRKTFTGSSIMRQEEFDEYMRTCLVSDRFEELTTGYHGYMLLKEAIVYAQRSPAMMWFEVDRRFEKAVVRARETIESLMIIEIQSKTACLSSLKTELEIADMRRFFANDAYRESLQQLQQVVDS